MDFLQAALFFVYKNKRSGKRSKKYFLRLRNLIKSGLKTSHHQAGVWHTGHSRCLILNLLIRYQTTKTQNISLIVSQYLLCVLKLFLLIVSSKFWKVFCHGPNVQRNKRWICASLGSSPNSKMCRQSRTGETKVEIGELI